MACSVPALALYTKNTINATAPAKVVAIVYSKAEEEFCTVHRYPNTEFAMKAVVPIST